MDMSDIVQVSTSDGNCIAKVRLFGATLVSWTVHGKELIFVSERAILHNNETGKPVRGGIPIVFPQFGPNGPLQQHGFARNVRWQKQPSQSKDQVVVLVLEESEYSLKMWPFKFRLELTVEVAFDAVSQAYSLTTSLMVINRETDKSFPFETLFHTYFRVQDIRNGGVTIHGLENIPYSEGNETNLKSKDGITFTGELDRVYETTTKVEESPSVNVIELEDHGADDKVWVELVEGLDHVVVWNPWTVKADSMADLGADQHPKFVCIEPGHLGSKEPLLPGHHWKSVQKLSYIKSRI